MIIKTSKLATTTFVLSVIAGILGIIDLLLLLTLGVWGIAIIFVGLLAGGLLVYVIMPLCLITLIFSLFAFVSIRRNNLKGFKLLIT
ncbi:MAG: hypothetical protein KJ600_06730 [Nanoarchaeota archaeon]|nr:hypothetical protein [Nanoarchaeota archaeon]